ncbi:MAG TPA: tryptophan--tRNA ligase [Candidatus Lambdaproteobacteria bacterium]|nr:tryptophan--tRNA ligase [SAR324 cluster bacterium]HIA57686.1 tryptophan--tRNA ligase [Candidatus Lambdaproteobacteria bacterium]HIN48726.1 tryptophan--tRNA ligase [Deltaproteobacteria bacterium]HIB45716.1 tryptophan--tRNA ligase [Candidatus Lambdaproteobacteria bacterium]HIB94067.1 tryptophan--tRNA ligase [Candidatus Lambdaproteobacteria bacterium]
MGAKPRSLSGIKPTGTPHLGNYLGMIKPAIQLQETHETFYFIADYHALTSVRDPEELRENTYDLTAVFAALGMDFENHAFFRQSDIPEVTELTWILSCITSKGLMERAHAYKDAVAKDQEVNMGLFSYPVLMACDILIYDSNFVPVGQDQRQHLEITRDIAIRFNHLYGEVFVIPDAIIEKEIATIPGLDGRKMSKSYGNVIPLLAPEKQFRKAIMKITTDSKSVDEPKDPGTCSVFALYQCFSGKAEQEALAERYRAGGMGYGEAKQICFDALNAELKEPREIYQQIRNDKTKLNGILESGRDKARVIARQVTDRVRDKVGL